MTEHRARHAQLVENESKNGRDVATFALRSVLYLVMLSTGYAEKEISPLDVLCSPSQSPCATGQCYTVGNFARCLCDSHYSGIHCDKVRLDAISYDVIGSVLIFKWRTPPRLSNYAFVYYEYLEPPGRRIFYKRSIVMRNNENSLIVGVLKGGGTRYSVCIEDVVTADRALLSGSDRWLTNCMEVVSPLDYHTMAGWLLASVLSTGTLIVVYTQREKFELMYFNNKYYLPRKT